MFIHFRFNIFVKIHEKNLYTFSACKFNCRNEITISCNKYNNINLLF